MSGQAMNPQQQEAVETLEGALLLLAGAGTGKTTVIIHRIANLLAHGYKPENILAVTFTNKAAREMAARLSKMVGEDVTSRLTVSTFHSFCCRILREHAPLLGFTRNFTLATESYQQGLVKELMSQAHQTGEHYDASTWLHQISMCKACLEGPEELRVKPGFRMADKAEIYDLYQRRLKQMDMMDFDDLLCMTIRLWQEQPRVLALYQERYQQLMIDEYQDTNIAQLHLMLELSRKHGNIAVVGDDDQSIYGWRGASLSNITEFESFFPAAKVIRLEQNYRSTSRILRAANSVIGHNKIRREKNLWSQHGDGEIIRAVQTPDETAEAEFVARYAREMHFRKPWSSLAVLFRSNHQARLLEQQLMKNKVPYTLVGANSFFQTKEIMDAVSLLKCAVNPKDDVDLLRVINIPPRGIGETTVMKLRELRDITHHPLQTLASDDGVLGRFSPDIAEALHAFMASLRKARRAFEKPGNLYAKARQFLEELDYINGLGRMYKPHQDALRRRDNVLEFMNSMAEFDTENRGQGTLMGFLEQMALDADRRERAQKEATEDAVTLMTIHAAKGLEFPEVILVGVEVNLLPNQRALEEGSEEEERRLFYVAITRAKEKLLISYADKRRVMGQLTRSIASPFVDELPQDDVKFCKPDDCFEKATVASLTALWDSYKAAAKKD